MRATLFLAAAAMAGLAAPAPAQAQVSADIRALAETPVVTIQVGESVASIPDLATISVGVMTTAPTAAAALAENSRKMERLMAAIRAAGVAEKDVQTTGIHLNAQYNYENARRGGTPEFTGYQVANNVQVKLRDIEEVGDFLDAMVAAGGTHIQGPYFSIEEPRPLIAQARRKALAEADAVARSYAEARGYSRARLISINEGGGYGGAPIIVTGFRGESGPPPVAPPPPPPVAPGQVSTGISLTVQYMLER